MLLLIGVMIVISNGCQNVLDPKPVDLLTDEIALNEPNDVRNVEIGLYNAFRVIAPATVIAGDMTADNLTHNGTFVQYRELGTKQITPANASVATLWNAIYNTVYIANFIIERLPDVAGVPTNQRNSVLATAHFLRGYAYFIGVYTFGGIPKVTSTSIEANRNIPRASNQEILDFILEDYSFALGKLTTSPVNPGYASEYAVRAALARYHLYLQHWDEAESFATNVISSNKFKLDSPYNVVVTKDFPLESIFEMGYERIDDPGTDGNIGLNNLFVGRREIIPSNEVTIALSSIEAGIPKLDSGRLSSIKFNSKNQSGPDNGFSVAKYGTADEGNNNVYVFRLAEMYLIRAEARTHKGNVTGPNSAQTDINILRKRAHGKLQGDVTQNQMIQVIEQERRFELSFEGHRWYDLVRTGRASAVMSSFSGNWTSTYELWPIPQHEIQNNPALVGNQNPGY
jgi:hypothetical protein